MKHLKIENNKGFYCITENEWLEIDRINKDDLILLIDKVIEAEFTMDEFQIEKIDNKAHQIIYRDLYQKFSELLENKSRFKDESEQLYKNAFDKYCVDEDKKD